MANSVSDIPDSLKTALKERRVIPFIGAGVSRSIEKQYKDSAKSFNPLFPSWKEFLYFASKKLRGEKNLPKAKDVIKLINLSEPDYLKSAEVAKNSLGTKLWNELINENFKIDEDKADINTLKYPQSVWKLGSNLIYTTNIDDVLEWKNVLDKRVERLDVQIDEFAELLQKESIDDPTVVYLHGHISNKSNIVFTKTQYEDFYDNSKNEAKLKTLHTFLTKRTFLFLGFSLDDPYFLRQLNYIHKIYNGAASSFYVLLPKWEKDNKSIPDFVKVITFSNFAESLFEKIDELIKFAESNDNAVGDEPDDGETQPPVEIKKDSEKPFFNVPYHSKGDEFVGREGKKEEIWEKLSNSGCASIGQAVSVKGFGGLGKTQLAVEFADAYKGKYKNGVYWLVADSTVDNQIVQIADELGWINQYDKSVNQIEVAKEKFRTLSDCLILVDNVEAFDDVKDYLPKTDSNTHLLITSREKDGRFHEIDIDLLKTDESRELLLKVSKRNPTDENEKAELEKILEILGGIPLAIELVGGFLKEHKDISFGEYLGYLENVPLSELEEEFPKSSFTYHDHSIIRTLRISEKTIEKNPLLVEILKVLAWNGSSSMGVSLLKDMIAPDNDFKFRIALSDAVNLRLINKDEKDERYTIHRLLAKVIRFEKPLAEQSEWHKRIVNNLESWFKPKVSRYEKLSEFEAELEHLREWQEQTSKNLPSEAILITAYRANLHHERGNYKKANEWIRNALNEYEVNNITNTEILSNLYNFLGVNNNVFGNNRKALEYQEKALELRKELFGEKHPDMARSYSNVGYTYGALGEHRKALEYQEKALELRKKLFGEKHPDTATSYNNVGSTYGALGDHRKALEYQEKAFQIQRELLGNTHPDTILYCRNLIITYFDLANNFKAREKLLEYFYIVPQNNPHWEWFEEMSRPYRPKKNRHKKR